MADTVAAGRSGNWTRRRVLHAGASFSFSAALPAQSDLFGQSIQTALRSQHPGLEFVVVDASAGRVLASTFGPEAIAPGSLCKPFLAAAYRGPALAVTCRGHEDRCWMSHGRIEMAEALALSCNAFFLALAAHVPLPVPRLPVPPANARPADLIGLTDAWRMSPVGLARAYAELLTDASTPAAVVTGMRHSAAYGTAMRLGAHAGGVLAKTGTAPCTSAHCKVSGDGLVIAAAPDPSPRMVLLVRKRGTTGALTAALAGPMLDELRGLHAY